MEKSEIKNGIQLIIEAIKTARENMDVYLKPYKDIKEHLDIIQSIEKENGIETGLDYEIVADDTLRSCINKNGDNEDIQNIEVQFSILLVDLGNWQEDLSDNESEQIQKQYVDILTDIQESFDVDNMESIEDLESQLLDMIKRLEDVEI